MRDLSAMPRNTRGGGQCLRGLQMVGRRSRGAEGEDFPDILDKRSFVADGDLVIGADHRCPAFFWVAAQGGYGIQTASAVAALAAAALLGREMPQHLAAHGVVAEALLPRRLR
jgi:hypothetical protein